MFNLSSQQLSFMQDFVQATGGKAFGESHVWKNLVNIDVTNAPEELDLYDNEMFLKWFEALYPHNGHGEEALDFIKNCADDNRLTLWLKPRSVGEKVLSEQAVREFYMKRGFVNQGGLMVREPLKRQTNTHFVDRSISCAV